eukprot:995314-Amphidinium_carterae.2
MIGSAEQDALRSVRDRHITEETAGATVRQVEQSVAQERARAVHAAGSAARKENELSAMLSELRERSSHASVHAAQRETVMIGEMSNLRMMA